MRGPAGLLNVLCVMRRRWALPLALVLALLPLMTDQAQGASTTTRLD